MHAEATLSTGVRILVAASVCTVFAVVAAGFVQLLRMSPDLALEISDAQVTKVGSVSQTGDQQVRVWLNVINRGSDDATHCVARSDLGGGLAKSARADINAGTTVTFSVEGVEHMNPDAIRHETDFHVWADCGGIESGKQSLHLVIEGLSTIQN